MQPGCNVRGFNSRCFTVGTYHQVDRAMLEVPALRIE
jgi:hypothetical protein